ncbi:hypothetical protein KC19_VG067300 [Ceratodon purpureus]|uniref:Uncharacterized protein n=1 Tax=Ceratodon purpureus TaxID=3225 RepID=A0A8T0HMN5_CERPU|nr:hypothetical protein KC19_VG067300 [Ceratodon purpureus]
MNFLTINSSFLLPQAVANGVVAKTTYNLGLSYRKVDVPTAGRFAVGRFQHCLFGCVSPSLEKKRHLFQAVWTFSLSEGKLLFYGVV